MKNLKFLIQKQAAQNELFIKAVQDKDYQSIERLLNEQVDIDSRNSKGDSAMSIAIYHEDIEMIQYLISEHAELGSEDNHLLNLSIWSENQKMIKLIFENSHLNRASMLRVLNLCLEQLYYESFVYLFENSRVDIKLDELNIKKLLSHSCAESEKIVTYFINTLGFIFTETDLNKSIHPKMREFIEIFQTKEELKNTLPLQLECATLHKI